MSVMRTGGPAPRRTTARAIVVAAAALLLASVATAIFAATARDVGQRLLSPLPAAPADVLLCALAVAGALLTVWLGLGVVTAALSAVPGAIGRVARAVADRVAPVAVRRGVALLLGTALVASFASGTATGSPLRPDQPGSAVPAGVTLGSTLLVVPLPDLRPPSGGSALDPTLRPPGASSVPGATTPGATTPGATTPSATTPSATTPSATTPSATTPSATTPGAATPTVPGAKRPGGSGGLGPLGPGTPRAALAPADRPTTSPPGAPGGTRSMAESVVVSGGDTLWDIAARHLGSRASAADVAAEWPRWYALNLDLIGDDPDRVLPGQRLVAPSPAHRGTSPAPDAPSTPTTPTTPTDGAS